MKLEKYIIPRSLYVLNVLKWGFELHINHIGYSEVHGLYHKKVANPGQWTLGSPDSNIIVQI